MTITKERAIEIKREIGRETGTGRETWADGAEDFFKALVAAGAFEVPKSAGTCYGAPGNACDGTCVECGAELANAPGQCRAQHPKASGLMTRARAEAAIDAAYGGARWPKDREVVAFLLRALDRAGAFGDEATLAEIAYVARTILKHESKLTVDGLGMGMVAGLALRLATACRAAGLVKP